MDAKKYILVNKNYDEIDRIVIRGQICNIKSITKDGVWLTFPNDEKKQLFRNINFIKEKCSFVYGILCIDRQVNKFAI